MIIFLTGQTESEWKKVLDEGKSLDPEVKVEILPQKLLIHTTHFTRFTAQYAGPVDVTVLMLIKLDSLVERRFDETYIKFLFISEKAVTVSMMKNILRHPIVVCKNPST